MGSRPPFGQISSVGRRLGIIASLANLLFAALVFVPSRPAAAGSLTYRIASSGDAGVRSRWFSLRGYGTIRSEVNWPKRTEGCAPFGGVTDKIAPWQGEYNATFTTGNIFTEVGNCSDRYHDAGTATNGGAWINPDALGGWSAAGVQTVNWGPVYPALSSNLVTECPSLTGGAATSIWGDPDGASNPDLTDQFYDSGPIGSYGTTPFPGTAPGLFYQNYPAGSPASYNLWSNGVSLFRQNFTLTSADLANLAVPGAQFLLTAAADDWVGVYINGVFTAAYTTTSSTVTTLDLTPYIPLLNLTAGATNTLAVMDADKARFYDVDPLGRQVGACYNLNISYTPPPPIVSKPAVRSYGGDVHAGGGIGQCSALPGYGNINTNAGADSHDEYVVSGFGNISEFGSNDSASSTYTLGKTGGYSVICRPDLLNAAQDYKNRGAPYTSLSAGTINLNNLSGVNIVSSGDVTINCGGPCLIDSLTTLVLLAGNLTINSPIQISTSPTAVSDIPSLGIITSGDIRIPGSVKRVDAYLFASGGEIDTCLEATIAACGGAPLIVNGFLMAHDIAFHRTGDGTVDGATLAEQVTLNPQIYLHPPMLFDASVDDVDLQGQGERQPLF